MRLLKDDIIKGCADAVRTASGSDLGIRAGDLAKRIEELSFGAVLLEEGEVTLTKAASSSARAARISLSELPDLFVMYLEEESEEVLSSLQGASVAAFCMRLCEVEQFLLFTDGVTNVGCVICRNEGYTDYRAEFSTAQVYISAGEGAPVARVCGKSTAPFRVDTYKWKSFKLWKEAENEVL